MPEVQREQTGKLRNLPRGRPVTEKEGLVLRQVRALLEMPWFTKADLLLSQRKDFCFVSDMQREGPEFSMQPMWEYRTNQVHDVWWLRETPKRVDQVFEPNAWREAEIRVRET